jgi:hypothetical protein
MKIKKHILFLLSIALVILSLPSLSEACPKCFASTTKQVLNAYYVSIAFMAVIPFGIIGSVLMWIYRQRRRQHTVDENLPPSSI